MKFGLTETRYNQLLADGKSVEEIESLIEEWGINQVNDGYAVFDYNGTGLLSVERIDDVDAFDSDSQAAEAAIANGVKIIPPRELPACGMDEMRFLGWIDTPENRKALAEYAKKFVSTPKIAMTS